MGVGKVKLSLIIALIVSLVLLGLSALSNESISQANSGIILEKAQESTSIITSLLNPNLNEKASPCDRIKENQIFVYNDQIIIKFNNAEWATFTDTNSMDPVIDIGTNALEYIPKSETEICVGDIVSYKSKYADGSIIHRVVEIGRDDNGWYAIMKGDNSPYKDPGKVRFDQIQRVVVGIIY